MNQSQARVYAMAILQKKRERKTVSEIAREVCGSSWLPDCPDGYMLQSGRITVPFMGGHVFDVRKLLREPQRLTAEPSQQEMFA